MARRSTTRNVDALVLARAITEFRPSGTSVELLPIDRERIRQQLVDHLIAMLGFDGETSERFDAIAMSPFIAERVS